MGNQKQKYGSKTKRKTNKKAGPGRLQKVIISRGVLYESGGFNN